MKKLLYTFFFGYLSLKWRRLFRTLIIIPFILLIAFLLKVIFFENVKVAFYYLLILSLIGIPIIIGLLSWLIKPFVVKED